MKISKCGEDPCVCSPRCPSCATTLVSTPHEVCKECSLRRLNICSQCRKPSDKLYGKQNLLKCASCVEEPFLDGWCDDCGLHSEFINSSKRCPECEADAMWNVFGDTDTAKCVSCGQLKDVNSDNVCRGCYPTTIVEQIYPTCDQCGRASRTSPCMNCNESVSFCHKCDSPFVPLGDETLCHTCSKFCHSCGFGLDKDDGILCKECKEKKDNEFCTSCGEHNRNLDKVGKCISCRNMLCPKCKINTIDRDEYLCGECLRH